MGSDGRAIHNWNLTGTQFWWFSHSSSYTDKVSSSFYLFVIVSYKDLWPTKKNKQKYHPCYTHKQIKELNSTLVPCAYSFERTRIEGGISTVRVFQPSRLDFRENSTYSIPSSSHIRVSYEDFPSFKQAKYAYIIQFQSGYNFKAYNQL